MNPNFNRDVVGSRVRSINRNVSASNQCLAWSLEIAGSNPAVATTFATAAHLFIRAPSRTGGAAAAVAILSILLLAGCGYDNRTDGKDPVGYRIVTIDRCEYLAFHTYGAEAITHKGNCTNHPAQ